MKVTLYWFLLACSVMGCGSSGDKQSTTQAPEVGATLTSTLDAYLAEVTSDSEPGIAIYIRHKGEVIYSGVGGLANKQTVEPITLDTGFRIASISKVFTALSVMMLVEQGEMALDSSILEYLPELPVTWQSITIHHLLSHQSGISKYESHTDAAPWLDGQTNDDVLNFYVAHPALDFAPGTQSEYSNSGYHLLAEIIGRASGQTYETYVQDNIFSPLAMGVSYVSDENTNPSPTQALNFAEYITFSGKNNYTNGANGVVSSINDLTRFIDGILNNKLVSEQSLETMIEHHSKQLFTNADYGYGWILSPLLTVDSFSHTGGHDGFRTWLVINRGEQFELIILGNGGDKTGDHGKIAELIQPFL